MVTISVHACGGLGNQMFQYAFGRALSLAVGGNLTLQMDWFRKGERPFGLDAFLLHESLVLSTGKKLRERATLKLFKRLRSMGIARERSLWGGVLLEPFPPRLVEVNFSEISKLQSLYAEGYWQSETYFRCFREELLHDFTLTTVSPSAKKWLKRISSVQNSVGLHVRRGDYAADDSVREVHGLLPLEYYRRADAIFREQGIEPIYFVFTDDTEWVKEHLSLPGEMFFVSESGCRDCEEMMLMSRCSHNVVANSSFSWWGGWLNASPSKVVVAPSKWFQSMSGEHIVPESWRKI